MTEREGFELFRVVEQDKAGGQEGFKPAAELPPSPPTKLNDEVELSGDCNCTCRPCDDDMYHCHNVDRGCQL